MLERLLTVEIMVTWVYENQFKILTTKDNITNKLEKIADKQESMKDRLNDFFEHWRSGDEYDREAITWVMACTSHFPGAFIQSEVPASRGSQPAAEL